MMLRLYSRRFLYLYALLVIMAFIWMTKELGRVCLSEEDQTALVRVAAESKARDDFRIKELEVENKLLKQKLQTALVYLRKYEKPDIVNSLSVSSITSLVPDIYAITPTYARCEQKAELTRLSQSLLHVKNFHWIIVEDSEQKTELVSQILINSGLKYTHLNVATPDYYKMQNSDPNWLKPRGVLQRNLGLQWLRSSVNPRTDKGVVYFMDDDNTYDLKLFEEMRYTRKVSVWPVGLVGGLRYESPLVENSKVTGWFTYWKPNRPFAMDMAGFAMNVKLLFDAPDSGFSLKVQRGYQESTLLTNLQITLDDLEPMADNCTKILVWHTRTEKSKLKNEDKMKKSYGKGSDPNIEV